MMENSTNISFLHTRISDTLPEEINQLLPKIINYRFGILPLSNMLTTEVRSHVLPNCHYQFNIGQLKYTDEPTQIVSLTTSVETPSLTEFQAKWTTKISTSRPEANVLGKFCTLICKQPELNIRLAHTTAENLAYYGAVLINQGDQFLIETPMMLPTNVVKFEENYESGYLALPEYGGGYYLETHDTPHFWSHLNANGAGFLLLAKQIDDETYHVSAFAIPYGQGIYAPGGVIHCDGLLIGDIFAIYTVTPDYSTAILKDELDQVVQLTILSD
ncbi:MAG: hypothetical protein HAW66_01765 [Shewanella sp.]|nr:hypothetical protein [Shewanella sp.]